LYDEIEIERKKKLIKSKLKKNYGIQSSINLMLKNVKLRKEKDRLEKKPKRKGKKNHYSI
jgi:hypothetical protein